MDGWTHLYPHDNPPDTQPTVLDQDWRLIEASRVSAQHLDAARMAELEHTHFRTGVGDLWPEVDVPLPFASPPGAAPAL